MCQQIKEELICATCGRCYHSGEVIQKCSQARRRGEAGNCSQRIIAHRGSPYRDSRRSCASCVAAYDRQMINDDDNYQNNYTW